MARARQYFLLVLTCTALVCNDIDHPILHLLAICVSTLGKFLFKSLSIFKLSFIFLLLSCKPFLHLLDLGSHQMGSLQTFSSILWADTSL